MAKGGKRKIAQKKAVGSCVPHDRTDEFVIVGNYKDKQLAWIEKNGVYNYPVREGDEFNDEALRAVKELWLFADVKSTRHAFAVRGYVGKMTKAEFVAKYPTYAKLPSGRARSPSAPHTAYYVFEVTPLDYEPAVNTEIVIARTTDFGRRTAKIRKAIEQFKQDGEYGPLAAYLPKPLTQVPPKQLRVSEEAVQMEFLNIFDVPQTTAIVKQSTNADLAKDGRLTCLDFFAGSGLVSEGLSQDFRTVWANDISAKKALVFNANNKAGILQVCPIENIAGHALPSVDMSWGSFPCQDLSLAGEIKGLYASRSGLFWQWLRVMDEMPSRPPVVVAENVVGLVSAAGGEYYVAAHKELSARGYRVGAVMLDAAHWLPQSRKRIFVIGVRRDVDISALSAKGPIWCHPDPVTNVAKLVDDWVWWNIPSPLPTQQELDDIVDFNTPCDSEAEKSQKLALISPEKVRKMCSLSLGRRCAFTGYRRTRNHKQVLEVRTDGMAGCLRTPGGGSSRQILIIAENGVLRTRLLTVREAARLMGAPDSFRIPGSYNDGYMAMGDAVAVPVVQYLSRNLLVPLALQSK